MLTAEVLWARAVEHGNAGRHAAARRALVSARARHPDPDLAGLIAGTWAYLASESGDPGAGAALADCEAALEDERLSAHTRAVLRSQLGLVALRRGDAEAALAYLSSAAGRLGGDPARLGQVLLNRGLVHLDRSEVAAAERDFGRAAEAFARADEPVGQAKAQNNQGYAAMLGGDLVAALRLMEISAPVLSGLSPVSAAVGDADRAEVLLAAGMTSEAVELLRRAARVYGARRLRQAQGEAELLLARSLAPEDPRAAAAVARTAARRFRRRGSAAWATRADAVAVSGEIADGRGGAALRRAAAATAAELDAIRRPDDAAALRLQLARSLVRSGATEAARATLDGIRLRPTASITTRLLADEVHAELAERAGRAGHVLRRAATGIAALQEWQSSFGSLELQSGAAVHGHRLAVQGVRAAVATGDPATVFAWSERVRALSSRVTRMRPPAQPEVAAALAELRAVRAEGAPGAAAREAELRERIRRSHWADDGAVRTAGDASLEEVRAALAADGAVLVAHLWTADAVAALVVTPAVARVVPLAPWDAVAPLLDGLTVDLDMAAARLPAAVAATVRQALEARLRRLDELLLAPLASGLGDARRLVLTPAGALAGVPWTMLETAGARAIALPDTASAWLAARGGRAAGSAGFAAGPGVARAEGEIAAAAAHWPSSVALTGPAATATAVAALAERVDLLHLAAHGRHTAENPLFSALELADGPWFGYDVDQLARVPGTILLSACELGRSAVRGGLEALSGARAWLHAGARSVVAAPAAVDDAAAAELLAATHGHLVRGEGPADALAAATAATGIRSSFLCHGAGW